MPRKGRMGMQPLELFVLTDTHYYSKKNWVDGDPYAFPPAREQLFRRGSEEILRAVFEELCVPGAPELVLISGDLTNNGEITSHEEIREMLRELEKRGKRVFVTTATHDYRGEGKSYGFDKNNDRVDVPAFLRDDLREFWREFGMDKAISVHEPTMCYAAELTPEYRLLALNDDKGYDHAGFTEECFAWIQQQAKEAREKGQFLIAMTHHPVLTPSPLYKLIAPGDLLEEGETRAKQFADMGVPVMFTGHSHIHNITRIDSEAGNAFYDVSTSATVGFPPNYRRVRFDPDGGTVDIKTIRVDHVPGLDLDGMTLTKYTEKMFLGVVTDILDSAENDYETFITLANGFSLREPKARKLKPVIRPAAKWLNHLTFGKVWKWTRRQNGVPKAEMKPQWDRLVVPFAVTLAANLYRGDADLPKDGVEYRVASALFRKLDRLSKPFADKLKAKGIESISAILLPLLHNDGIPDADYTIRL